MLRFSRSFITRSHMARRTILPDKMGDIKDTSWLSNYISRFGVSTASSGFTSDGNYSGRTYADYTIFKGKAAMSVNPVPPTFSKIDSGASIVDKKGIIMLRFMPAIGQRKYDSGKKQVFALSATEVGCLISLGPAESCEFFHDPSMKSSLEGQVKKTLAVSPLTDGSYMFNLSVMNCIAKSVERISVPVTKAEFAVMRSALGFALPHIMGWDRVVSPRISTGGDLLKKQRVEKARLDPDYEWGR